MRWGSHARAALGGAFFLIHLGLNMHCSILMFRGQKNAIRCCHSVMGKAITSSTVPKPFADVSNKALGLANRHLVYLLMQGLCRAANSCKRGLVVGAYVSRVMVCARLPDSMLFKKIQDASWRAQRDIIACGIVSAVLHFFTIFVLSLA